jgi:hypothetical protein
MDHLLPEKESYYPFDVKEDGPIKPGTVAERFLVVAPGHAARNHKTKKKLGKSVFHQRKHDFHTVCCYVHCS